MTLVFCSSSLKLNNRPLGAVTSVCFVNISTSICSLGGAETYRYLQFELCIEILNSMIVGLGGLEVMCSPRDQRFAGSNPAEVDGFFQDLKILSTSPPGGTVSWGSRKNSAHKYSGRDFKLAVPSLRFQAR